MRLVDDLIRQGRWSFRWRSYLPFAILPVLALAFWDCGSFGTTFRYTIEQGWDFGCLTVALTGLTLRVLTVGFVPSGTSGRTTQQRADKLNTTGMYSIVRHPLYLANFLVFLGLALALKSAMFTLVAVIAYVIFYERIILAEEDFLDSIFSEQFREWATKTPTIIPRPNLWIPHSLPFSWRTALLREYHGLTSVGAIFFTIKLNEGLLIKQQSLEDWFRAEYLYVALLAGCVTFYLVVRFIRKSTSWLTVTGRGP